MVQALRSRRSHPSLSDGIGSRRPERRVNLPYPEAPHATIEAYSIAAVAIMNQKSWRRSIPSAAFHDLLCDPASCRMSRHFNVEDLSVGESDDEEDVKRLEQDRWDAEKVASPNVRCMPRQELSPRSGWAPPATHSHIFGYGPGGNLKPYPCQFGLDALLTPKAILGSHASNQSLKLSSDRRATTSCLTRRSPPPVRLPTRSVPAQNRFRFDNQQRITPIAEPSTCKNPKAPIGVAQARPRMPAPPTAGADKGFPRLAAPLA
jgi:hypothetical protein